MFFPSEHSSSRVRIIKTSQGENKKTDLNEIEHFKQQFQTNKTFLMQWFEVLEWTNYIQKKHNSKELIFETFIELSTKHWSISLEEMRVLFKIINANSKY